MKQQIFYQSQINSSVLDALTLCSTGLETKFKLCPNWGTLQFKNYFGKFEKFNNNYRIFRS